MGRAGREQGEEERRDSDKFIRHVPDRELGEAGRGKARASPTARSNGSRDAVDKPWEGWDLRMEVASAPRSGDGRRPARRRSRAARRRSCSVRSTSRSHTVNGSRSWARTAVARRRCSHALLGRAPARRRATRWIGSRRRGRRARPGARRFDRRRRCSHAFRRATGLPPATPVRCSPSSGSAPSTSCGRRARCRRVSARAPVLALFTAAGVELPRARRADEPPRPARDRAARTGARHVHGTVLLVTHDRRLLDAVR